MAAFGGKADSASDCRGQSCGVSRILHAAGASDLVLRNVNTRQFEVYDIVNNQITSAFNIGAVGLDFQLGGFAVDPPTVSGKRSTRAEWPVLVIVPPLPPRRAAVEGSRAYRKWRGAAPLRGR